MHMMLTVAVVAYIGWVAKRDGWDGFWTAVWETLVVLVIAALLTKIFF